MIIELEDRDLEFSPNETYEVLGIVTTETDEEYEGVGEKRIEIIVKEFKKIVSQ